MDYDDNDFQSQNLHLVGEGSTKFPPALTPYTLPKFDFDESLQGHLRFDSLVETEVFLGIENNEDNQWIDAYSRGTSGIEFGSTAAESCTISRHNNVWSEATSSESVEMLLKSVGQEEFIPKESVIQESDACDELACLAKQMEPNSKPNGNNEFKDRLTDLQPTGSINENLSGLKEDVERDQSVAGVSQCEISIDGSLSNLEPHDMHGDLSVSRGILLTDGKRNDTSQKNPDTVADGFHEEKIGEDLSASGLKASFSETSTQNISSTCDVSNIQNVQNQVDGMGDEQQSSLEIQANKQNLDSSMINKDPDVDTQTLEANVVGCGVHHSDKPLCSMPMEEAVESGNVVEGLEPAGSNLGGSLGMVSGDISDSQKAEECNDGTCFKDLSQGNAKNGMVGNQSALDTSDCSEVAIKDESGSERNVVGEDSNSNCNTCPNFQQNVGTSEKDCSESSVSKEKELLNISNQMDKEVSLSKSEASMFAVGDSNTSTVSKGNSDNKKGKVYSLVLVASAKSCVLGEEPQVSENNQSDKQGDHENICQDVYAVEQVNEKVPFESSLMPSNFGQSHHVDTGISSTLLGAGSMETKLPTSTISVDVMPVTNSASHCISKNISSTSCKIVDDPPPPDIVVSTHEIADHSEVQGATVVEKEDSKAKIADETSMSIPVGFSEVETAPCVVTVTEKEDSSDTSRQLSRETVVSSVTTPTENISGPQATLSDKVDQDCTKEVAPATVLCESAEKQGNEVSVSLTRDDMGAIKEKQDKSSFKISGDISVSNQYNQFLPDYCTKLQITGSSPKAAANPTDNNCGAFESPPDTENNAVSAKLNPPVSEGINKVVSNKSNDPDCKGNDASKDERSLTPEVNPVANLSKKDVSEKTTKGKNSRKRQVPVTAAHKASMVVEESPLPSALGTPKTRVVGNISHVSPQTSDGDIARNVSQGTTERKTRRASNKTDGKESSRKGNKGKTPARLMEKGDRSASVSQSPSPGFQLMQTNEVQQYGHVESINAKPFSILNASASSLPDLNSSTSPSILFQQPFMDNQQLQLRAQIFVYGALIQGTVPEEMHMVAAFGGPDGRSLWQNAWSSCMERQHGKKSHPINPETPLQSRSGPRTTDLAVKQNALQGKGISPLGLASSSKATPAIANPLIPLSSPLWSLPTPSCDSLQSSALARGSVVDYPPPLNSLHPYQTPPLRNFIGHNASWISQSPLRGPWTPTPAPDNNNSHLSAPPVIDTIKLSSVKGSSVPPSSTKNVPPGQPASSAGLQSVFVATAPPLDANNVTVAHAQLSTDPKPKKRKKVVVSEDPGQKAIHSQSQLVPSPAVSSHISAAFATASPVGSAPITTIEKSVVSVTPLSHADHLKNNWTVEKRILSDESLTKIDEARVSAEEASALSAAAVNHSLEIWKQLDKQKNSGLVSDIEAKLASAAVAVAAAAAVAKAAAAAANVASNAALHAKLMAEEALVSSGNESSSQLFHSEGLSNFGKATPASILKGTIGTKSSISIIGAAKEAARRRVEAASAARKRAENMDAIVKAAELTAEAVSQVGKIVTMGDPMALNDIVEAGPAGCWNEARESSQQIGLLKDMTSALVSVDNIGDIPEASHISNRDISSDEIGKNIAASEKSPLHPVHSEMLQDHNRSLDGISPIVSVNERSSKGPKGRKVSDLVNPSDVIPESETEIQASFTVRNGPENLEENNIKEGSLVEVLKDGEGSKAAWFTANILSLKDGKAYVCYSVLVDGEGTGPLKEWVSLEGEEDKPPRIRTARPLIGLHNEGTRKRRRGTMVDYTWSIGDRVDAWIQESWQEGVITDKNKKDKTTLTVHFPASGETAVVRAWHLRPSLIWRDGKWIEYLKVGANDSPTHEGDTPHEKRPKLGNPAEEAKGKDRIAKGADAVDSMNPGDLRLLHLTENDKVFNIGKNSKNENKSDAHRMVRTGLQKEGSRVIFGVPKPGKKRKFMEVSKHYNADGTSKTNDGRNDSVKLANFLIPQASGSRGWKNSSKNDTKEKLGAESKPFKSGRQQGVSGRLIPPKESTLLNSHANELTSHTERIKDSSSHFKNASQSENQAEKASYSGSTEAGAGPILYSSLASSTDSHPTRKTSRASKGKLAPAGGRMGKVDEEKALNGEPVKSTSEVIEPRRSNRRIQPTSRLLEGLQSSLIISKIPSGSHEKGHKTQNRNTSRGN